MKRADAGRLTEVLTQVMPELMAYLQRRVRFDDAPDLLGEALVVAWRRVDEFPEDPEVGRMWLFGIARGTLLNHTRGKRRQRALAERIRGFTASAAPAADHGADVRDAIDRLPVDQGELIRLVHWDGFTVVEAAELLELPLSTARSRYRRAKDALRTTLAVPLRS